MKSLQSSPAELAFSRPCLKPPEGGRILAIDLARGFAISLMILNHGVKGLLPFEAFPGWGLVPVHLVTRFSSSLFIMIFGIALALVYLPQVSSSSWPQKRLKLLLSGVVIFFWYKVLTVFEMLHPYTPQDILDTLLFRNFPSFVEILGFYALALLWIPFFLPLWSKMPLLLRLASPALLALVSYALLTHFHFWGLEPLQAILVEHEDYYTWGQLSRGPLILLGLLLGELFVRYYPSAETRKLLAGFFALVAVTLFALFALLSAPDLQEQLVAIAYNQGKHPPELLFMLFSMSGAFMILAVITFGGEALASWLRPFTLIGRDALQAFIFHIAVIFVGFRFLLGYWHNIAYNHALGFTLCLIFATALWIKIVHWMQQARS